MRTNFQHAPNPCDLLSSYREVINLDYRFEPTSPGQVETRELLQAAIQTLWDRSAEKELDVFLPVFLKYIAKDVSTLRQLLQLASQACATISLTDRALQLVDQAYAAAGTTEHDDHNFAVPNESHRFSNSDYLLVYRSHHEVMADATVLTSTENFALPPGDYRSYRLNALSGPRARRDCALIRERINTNPWAVITRGYFFASRFLIHCRRPYLDSDMSIRQRLQLREAIMDTLSLAFAVGARTVSLPLICPGGSSSTESKAYRTTCEAVISARTMGWRFKTVHLTGVANSKKESGSVALSKPLSGLSPAIKFGRSFIGGG